MSKLSPLFKKNKTFIMVILLLIPFCISVYVITKHEKNIDISEGESTVISEEKKSDLSEGTKNPILIVDHQLRPTKVTEPSLSNLLAEDARKEAKKYREDIKSSLTAKGIIKGIQEIPMSKLFFVEAQQGTYFVSGDGRYVFEGVMKDVWHRKTIKSLEDARTLERTPVSNIGFEPEKQLATFTIGNPSIPRQGVAFIDPTSDYTMQFLKKLMKDEDSVHWTVILMPLVGGNQAVDRARRLHCAVDQNAAKKDLINGTSLALGALKSGCTEEKIMIAMLLTDIYQIRSLPHLIREDGLVSKGFPKNFTEWFAQP